MSKFKRLLALTMALCLIAGIPVVINTPSKADDPTVLQKAELVSDSDIKLTFSDDVHISGEAKYFTSIRCIDNFTNQNLMWRENGGVTATPAAANDPAQWSGDLIDNQDGTLTFRLHEGHSRTLKSIFTEVATSPAYSGSIATWSIENQCGELNGLVESILDSKDNPVSATSANGADRVYFTVTDPGVITLDSVIVNGDKTLILQFSGEVQLVDSPWTCIRLLNGMATNQQELMWNNGGVVSTAAVGDPMQWGGSLSAVEGDATKLLFTAGPDLQMSILKLYNWVNSTFPGNVLAFGREDGTGVRGDGFVDSIAGKNGEKVLATRARTEWGDSAADQLYGEIKPATVLSAKMIGERTVAVKFSTPITYVQDSAFTALRVINGMGENQQALLWNNGGVISTTEAGDPLQFYGSAQVDSNDNTQLIFTLNGDQPTVRQLLARTEMIYGGVLAFGREDGGGQTYSDNGATNGVIGLDGSLIRATRADGLDRLYCPIEKETQFMTLQSASIEDDKNLLINFGSVSGVWNNGGVYTAIRLVDSAQGQNLMWLNEDKYSTAEAGTPLQWGGNMSYIEGVPNTMRFTLVDATLGLSTIPEIMAYAKEHDLTAMYYIGESYPTANNAGDNLVNNYGLSENGPFLKATKYGGIGGWDAALALITDAPVLQSVTRSTSNPGVLELKFSEAVTLDTAHIMTGSPSAFVGIGFIDNMENQNLMFNGADSLHYGANLSIKEGDDTVVLLTLQNSYAVESFLSQKRFNSSFASYVSAIRIEDPTGMNSDGHIDVIKSAATGKGAKASKVRSWADQLYFEIPDIQTIDMTSVKQVNADHLMLTFNTDHVWNVGSVFSAIRLVDNTTSQNLMWDGGTPLQFDGYVDSYVSDNQLSWTFTGGSGGAVYGTKTINDVLDLTKAGGKFEGYVPMLCMEELNDGNAYFISENGLMDTYGATNASGNKLAATKRGGLDAIYKEITALDPNTVVTVSSIEVTSPSTLKVTFSDEINYVQSGCEAWLRLADARNDIVCAKGDGTYTTESQLASGHQQWGGTLSPTGDKKVFTWTSTGLLDAAASFAANKTELEKVGARFTLCFEQYGAPFTIPAITSVDGNKVLVTNGVIGNRSFQPVTGMDSLGKVTVSSITPVSDNQLKITFSDEVVFGKNTNGKEPEFWLRLMANDVSIAIKKADGSFGSENGGATGEYCQWSGTIAPTENKKEYIWTMNSYNTLGLGNLANVKTFMANNAEGLASVGAKLTLCCEQSIPAGVIDIGGYIDNVTTENGLKVLEGNNSGGYRNFGEVTGMEDVRGITVKSAVAIDSRTVKVTFSEPVVNNVYDAKGGFISMRLVDENDNLMFRTNKDGKLTTEEKPGENMPVQFGGDFKPTDDPSVWLFTTSSSSISYMLDTVKPDGIWAGYKYKFCIEQQLNEAGDNEMGFVDNFTSPDGKHKLEGAVFLWDRCYVPVSIGYSDPYFDTIHMESAKAVDDQLLMVQFSEPVEIVGGPFCAIRLVEPGSNFLGWDGEENTSTPIQFAGYMAYADEKDHSKMYFVLSGGQLFGVKTVQDILNFNGDLEPYKGVYTPAFCIEKIGYGANSGVVENVIAEGNPNKVLEAYNCFYRIGYLDGAYCPITNDFTPTELKIESVTAINDLQLVVKFNAPVVLNADNAPFMAIRLVDDDNNLLWDGEVGTSTPMQFTGDWAWHNEEHTEIVWTMHGGNTYGAGNVREVLNKEGKLEAFKDAKIAFCIEELPPNIFGNSGHIDNIRLASDERNHLLGNKAGGYDGVYTPIDVKFDLEPLTYSATAINDIQLYIQFNDSVEIVNSPWMSIRYVGGDNTLLWSNGEGTSTPMQFAGTWEWANASHTAIIWTMNGANTCLANSITDVMNHVNALCAYEGCGIKMCIEELASEGFAVHSFDNLLSNIYSADGTRHLSANKNGGYDGSYKNINIAYDTESTLEITKVISKTDKTVNLTFNKPVEISDEAAMGLCFVDGNGTVAVGIDARDMKYKGTWKYVNDDKTEIEWTIKDGAGTIADMLGYKGAFSFYKDQGLSLKFYIQEHEGCRGWNKMVEDVTTDGGKVHLLGSMYADQDMFLTSLETEYEIAEDTEEKDVETDTEPETVVETKEVEDYTMAYVIGGGVAAIGLAIGLILGLTKKKKN